MDVDAPASAGSYELVTASTHVSNLGPSDVSDAVVVFSVPTGDVRRQDGADRGTPVHMRRAGNAETVSCTGPLVAGRQRTFAVTSKAPGAGTMTHSATVSSSVFDPATENDSDTASTEVTQRSWRRRRRSDADAAHRDVDADAGTGRRHPRRPPSLCARASPYAAWRPLQRRADPQSDAAQRRRSPDPLAESTAPPCPGRDDGRHGELLFSVRMKVRMRSGDVVRVTRRHAACEG